MPAREYDVHAIMYQSTGTPQSTLRSIITAGIT